MWHTHIVFNYLWIVLIYFYLWPFIVPCAMQNNFLPLNSQLNHAQCKWTFYLSTHSQLNYPCPIRWIIPIIKLNSSNLASLKITIGKTRMIITIQLRNELPESEGKWPSAVRFLDRSFVWCSTSSVSAGDSGLTIKLWSKIRRDANKKGSFA